MTRERTDGDFTEFVRAYSTRLLRFAEMLCGERHQAEDLVQHALMRCYPKWQRIEGDPLAYVRRAVVNRFMSQARRRWNRERVADPQQPGWDSREVADFAPGVQDREAVLAALAVLTARERAVVVLRYSQDLSEADTAAALGIATGTVKSTCARALGKLRLSPDLVDATVGGRA
jgi:RNA polymerase sigma-70 factor (sigma-E family)